MILVCQALRVLFTVSAAIAAPPPAPTAAPEATTPQAVDGVATFADVVLDDPRLAAVLLLNPGWQGVTELPERAVSEDEVRAALARQLDGLAPPVPPQEVRVFVARGENVNPSATAWGNTVLVLLREPPPVAAEEIARMAAPALLAANAGPAAPDDRAGEPLLAFAEAVVRAGELSLMALPPALRPVHDWLEPREAGPALATLAETVFDRDIPWPSRQVRLARIMRPGGAGPELANAAAMVLEAFGDIGAARRRPLDVLLAWRDAHDEPYPPVPPRLKRALDHPLEAGVPDDEDDAEARTSRAAIARAALSRLLAQGDVPEALPENADRGLRVLAAANARAHGGDPCRWLGSPLPAGVRTGCRDQDEDGGWLYARPRTAGGGFEVLARSAAGEEMLLLRWPSWVLFPRFDASSGDLVFADPDAIWRVRLRGGESPRRALEGAFRHLDILDGVLAAVDWPGGDVTVVDDDGPRRLPVDGRGGVAWLERGILVASSGDGLRIVSSGGEATEWPGPYHCSRFLARGRSVLVGGVTPPCTPGLVRLSLVQGSVEPFLALPSAPAGMTVLPGGAVVFGTADGLFQWDGGETANRVGAGLTPGPG